MSLCATGTPVSGPPLPAAISASAAAASRSVLSASTVMKALSVPLSAAMRSRYCCATSRLETCLAASCAASAERDVSDMLAALLDDFGHEIQTVLHRRGDGLEGDVAVCFGHGVVAQALVDLLRVGHRGDPAGID